MDFQQHSQNFANQNTPFRFSNHEREEKEKKEKKRTLLSGCFLLFAQYSLLHFSETQKVKTGKPALV